MNSSKPSGLERRSEEYCVDDDNRTSLGGKALLVGVVAPLVYAGIFYKKVRGAIQDSPIGTAYELVTEPIAEMIGRSFGRVRD